VAARKRKETGGEAGEWEKTRRDEGREASRLTEGLEESGVFAVVERGSKALEGGLSREDLSDFGGVDDLGREKDVFSSSSSSCCSFEQSRRAHLLLDIHSLHPNHAGDDGDRDEGVVVHEFRRGEGRESVDEQLSSLLEVSDGEEVKTLVDLQPITSIPISSFINEPASERRRSQVSA